MHAPNPPHIYWDLLLLFCAECSVAVGRLLSRRKLSLRAHFRMEKVPAEHWSYESIDSLRTAIILCNTVSTCCSSNGVIFTISRWKLYSMWMTFCIEYHLAASACNRQVILFVGTFHKWFRVNTEQLQRWFHYAFYVSIWICVVQSYLHTGSDFTQHTRINLIRWSKLRWTMFIHRKLIASAKR